MSSLKSSTETQQGNFKASEHLSEKGKGKAVEKIDSEMELDEEDNSSEDEVEETASVEDEVDEDNMEEIDLDNIVGRRTRGRKIDFAKAAEELAVDDDDEDDDEDGDFEGPDDEDKDRMEE